MIEKGRHTEDDVEERCCYTWSEKKMENELHFLLEYPADYRIRTGINNFYKSNSPETDNFVRLLSCEGRDTRNGQSCEKPLINPSFISSLYCDGQLTFLTLLLLIYLMLCCCHKPVMFFEHFANNIL